ncbi:hypothetical protein [Oceanicola sp. 502str15]|uniref:hypothetical protein n=1 Tax=Oceanicola sp. 502str15 TaxID=2696061 RepID=UPI0020965E62|nr:hypothetical protein [Oceanicola sp. 502str15]MCO6381852.1 hypothetical protein [Oceanicola sp. 502str15]
MLHLLLVGSRPDVIAQTCAALAPRARCHPATTQAEAEAAIAAHPIDAVIMGAGSPMAERLAIAEAALTAHKGCAVHLKDKASGPARFTAWVEGLIAFHEAARA